MVNKNKKNILKKIKNLYHKKITNNRLKYNFKEILLSMLITFSLGLVVGGIIMYGRGKYHSSTALNEFASIYDEITSSYYKEIDDEELLESGIKGMIGYLGDPYSSYMDSKTASNFSDDVEGIYEGIGAEIKLVENDVIIGKVFENSPSEKAGLKENDVLLKVDGNSIKGMSLVKISNIVKGNSGTIVTLSILRDNKEMDLEIKRGKVDSISVTSEIIEKENKKIGYIYISLFASNTKKQFEKELKYLEENKIDSLIIDVRDNQGGYLTTVNDIISLFIKKGEPIYQLKTKDKVEIIYDKTNEYRDYPIVMLANSLSASASEVLIGALKESYGATIVGTNTFGKGKVQKMMTLSNGAIYKYTYQEWLTPKGNYIDEKGIKPDIEIKYVYSEKGEDNQKNKAIETILTK